MKYKTILLCTVAAVSVVAASQSNARNHGWYIGVEGGANWVDDNDAQFDWNPYTPSYATRKLEFDTGWAVLGTAGYKFSNGWRLEGEVGYRENDFDFSYFKGKHRGYPDTEVPSILSLESEYDPYGYSVTKSGTLTEITLMFNVIYDIPVSERITLSLGVGAGVDFNEFETHKFEDDDTNFAFQAIAGVNYALTKRLDLTLTYRYLHVDEPSYYQVGAYKDKSWNLEDLEKHTLTIGLRYDLYEDEAPLPPAPPPPPPPPPVDAPDQFVIFFGFDKCNITAEADGVLSEAAAAYKSSGEADVRIEGHTDTMGSNAYNTKLSNCRAGAAARNLVAKGVPEDAISKVGKGESQLLIKTGDQVKEPQNRRATIDIDKADGAGAPPPPDADDKDGPPPPDADDDKDDADAPPAN